MVIFSKVVACTSQPVAVNGHPSTRGHLTGLINKMQKKQASQLLRVVFQYLVSLLMEPSVGNENILCHCVRM